MARANVVETETGKIVATVLPLGGPGTYGPRAILIATSPELLGVCESVLYDLSGGIPADLMGRFEGSREILQGIIAKATGKPPNA